VLARARSREPALDASARVTLVREPFEIAPDAEIVRVGAHREFFEGGGLGLDALASSAEIGLG